MPPRTRGSTVSLLGVGLALALIALGVGWSATRAPGARAPRASAPAPSSTGTAAIEDLLSTLQIVPMDGQAPSPFTLPALDGTPVSLADLRGRPALLYFWASW